MNRTLIMKGVTFGAVSGVVLLTRVTGAFSQLPSQVPQSTETTNPASINQVDTSSNLTAQTPNNSAPTTPATTPPSTNTTPTNTSTPTTGSSGGAGSGSGSGTPTPTPTPTYKFRNGTYTATGNYSTPGGTQSVKVTLTVSNDTIIDSTVVGLATSQPSKNYQQDFIANYKPYVIGKKIDQVSLTKVASSSLTPTGFNNATNAIETQAKI